MPTENKARRRFWFSMATLVILTAIVVHLSQNPTGLVDAIRRLHGG